MSLKNAAIIGLLLPYCLTVEATTYYIDSENGSDRWSGQTDIISGTDGPWRSLSSLAGAGLQPGDSVLLRCDRVWRETLTINKSGTVDAPIIVGAYGDSCVNAPKISGLRAIPDYAWEPSGNGIWKAQFPLTLLKNGYLSDGSKKWRIWSANNDATVNSTVDTCLAGKTAPCLNVSGGSTSGLLSSATFPLVKGANYKVKLSSLLSMKQLIPNGNFASGVSKWSAWSKTRDLQLQSDTSLCLAGQAAPCLSVVSNASNGLLSSAPFPVVKGESYTLTFSSYIPNGKVIKAVVRQAGGSYSPLGLISSNVSGDGTWQNHSFTFTATATENAARLDFEIPSASNIQFQNVNLKLSKKAVKAIVRQDGGGFQVLGLNSIANSSDSQWQDSSFTFNATQTVANARLDFEIPLNSVVQLQQISLSMIEDSVSVSQLLDSHIPQAIAHHPNKGYDSALPDSMFFKTASNSRAVADANNKLGSNYILTGSDFFIPDGKALSAGTHVTIRDQGWSFSHVTVSAVTGNKIEITPNTKYPIYWTGLGYFFTGEQWMLDSAGEWYFDATAQVLYYYPKTNTAPSNNIQVAASGMIGADLTYQNYIQMDGININGVELGVNVGGAANISLNNLTIENVKTTGVLGTSVNGLTLQNSRLTRIGEEGIRAWNSSNISVKNNVFDQIGLIKDAEGRIISIPNYSTGAIVVGTSSIVSQNSINNFAYVGINALLNSEIHNNYLTNGCLVLNDCGAIYADATSSGTKITGNVINGLVGNIDGLPSPPFSSHSVGVYTDNNANGNVIDGNTVSFADYGIHLHNSHNQQIQNNLLFASRRSELWIQESSKAITATGDVHDLVISGNQIFPTIPSGQVKLNSSVSSLYDFGGFDGDIFSNYYAPNVASEKYGTSLLYTLPQWQSATVNGVARGLELNGKVAAPLLNYGLGLLQSNIVTNANFENGLKSWSKYGTGGAGPTITLTTCTPEQAQVACIKADASSVAGNVSTPVFDIKKDYNYLLSFDVMSSVETQVITALVRQAGPTMYNSVMGSALTGIQGTTGWKRYSVIFKATADARTDGSVVGVSGARIDFSGINPGQSIWLANLELVPVGDVPLPKYANIITNPATSIQSFNCPSSDTFLCNNIVNFADGRKVQWPLTLPALGSAVIFSQSLDYPDADHDGVPDSQDSCANTALGLGINSTGCPLQ